MNMTLNGININYYDRGEGTGAVLFLHGWGSDFSVFRVFLERISGFRVCAFNLPGFGGSDEPPRAWGVDDYADFALAFCAELGVKSAVLIGHSFGGRIAVKLAARKNLPVDIPKMILIDSAGIRAKRSVRQIARLLLFKLAKRLASKEVLEKWRKKMGSEDYRNASPRMRECLVKAISEDLTPCLPSISCPTLLVWGENDTATPLSDGKVMEKLIPGSGLVVLKNAGHYSFLDQGYTFGRVLNSFLGFDKETRNS